MTRRFANLSERLRAELPEGSSSRLAAHRIAHDSELTGAEARAAKRIGADAVAMLRKRAANGSTSALDELKRLDLPATAPASSAKATASSAPVAPVASTAPKAPAKSAKAIAMDAANARINAVFDHPASAGKKKAAGKLLHMTKASASEIITQLKTMEPDADREAKENEEMWRRATAKANAMAGFRDEPAELENGAQVGWAKVVAKVNAMNGYAS